tara:strand:- start:738 stop:1124 length:387 start_codon:yes stop_codon:yes gene_type:complete
LSDIGDIDEQETLSRFAVEALAHAEVWALKGEDGWALCASIEFEDTEVLPFFSNKESAALLCSGDWEGYLPDPIPLESFLEDWLPGMHEDNALLGLNWNPDMEGAELEPAELAKAIESALETTLRPNV